MTASLDARLLQAHAAGDTALLAELYALAAESTKDQDAQAFFLTHAHVYALECGAPDAAALRERLIAMGRETPV